MTVPSNFSDTTKCPLCGEANQCAIAAGQDAESCWCMSVVMTPDTLKSIPAEAQGRVCICARCASAPLGDEVLEREENHER